jgi:hypothetical protein
VQVLMLAFQESLVLLREQGQEILEILEPELLVQEKQQEQVLV